MTLGEHPEIKEIESESLERCLNDIEGICAVSETFDYYQFQHTVTKITDLYQKLLDTSFPRVKYLIERFRELGFNIQLQEFLFEHSGTNGTNAVFKNPNADPDSKTFYIVAHHDYINGKGASDNASSMAAMLELARFVITTKLNVVFVSFDCEEINLNGSRYYVNSLSPEELAKIDGVICLECLGGSKDIVLPTKNLGAICDKYLIELIMNIANRLGYRLSSFKCPIFHSDHVSFSKMGVPAIEICDVDAIEFLKHPYSSSHLYNNTQSIVHHPTDLPENLNTENIRRTLEIMLEFLRDHSK